MGKWDKYKKNKPKQENVDNDKTNINCLSTIYATPLVNPYK